MADEYKLPYSAENVAKRLEQAGQAKEDIDKHKTDLTSHVTDEERQGWNNKSNFSGNFNDLIGKPTKLSEFENDANFITEHQDISGKEEKGTAAALVSSHNTEENAHNDIRIALEALKKSIEAFLDIDDESMNQATEFVAYMKDNRELIEQITTSKVNVSDIVDDYATNVSNKPVSAAVAVKLKALIDAIIVPTKTSQLTNDSGFLTQHQDLSGYAKKATTLSGYGITDGVTKEELEQLSIPSVIFDASTKTLNISSGGVITSETITEISDYVSKYEVEKIVLDGVELEFTGYASKEEVSNKTTIHTLTGNKLYQKYYDTETNGLAVGDIVVITETYENGKDIVFNKGDMWKITAINTVQLVVNLKGQDAKTPIKGIDYFTEEEIEEIVNSVYNKVADGNEVAY